MTRVAQMGLLCALVAMAGCKRNRAAPIPASDGKYSLVTSVNRNKADRSNYLCVVLEIYDAQGTQVAALQTGASDRLKWAVAWDKSHRVWLDSSDIGTYYYELQADGIWKEFGYVDQKRKGKAPNPPHGLRHAP